MGELWLSRVPLKWGVRSPTQRLETGRTSAPGDTRQVRTHQTGVDHNLVAKTLSLLLSSHLEAGEEAGLHRADSKGIRSLENNLTFQRNKSSAPGVS